MNTRKLGGVDVSEIGFGGMNISLAGRAPDAEGVKVIHAAIDAGMTLIDTADSYCADDNDFHHNEALIARALSERPADRDRIFVATKGGYTRPNGGWTLKGDPEHLRKTCEDSLRALGVETIDLLQLHGVDPAVPVEESVGAMAELQREGKVRRIGLSNVTLDELDRSQRVAEIVSVQNEYSPYVLKPERDGVLEACRDRGIAFLPWAPLGSRNKAKDVGTQGALTAVASAHGVSPQQVVLAWMLAKWPNIIPIPGARRIESVRDSAAAAALTLSADEVAQIDASLAAKR